MSTPTVGDGHPILGDVVVVIDESSPGNGLGGIAYVVTAAALISPGEAAAALSGIFGPHRVRLRPRDGFLDRREEECILQLLHLALEHARPALGPEPARAVASGPSGKLIPLLNVRGLV